MRREAALYLLTEDEAIDILRLPGGHNPMADLEAPPHTLGDALGGGFGAARHCGAAGGCVRVHGAENTGAGTA